MSSGNRASITVTAPSTRHPARTRAFCWQQQLADRLEEAVRPNVAGVFLCPLGNVLDASAAMAPRRYAFLGQRLTDTVVPRCLRDGVFDPYRPLEPEAAEFRAKMQALRQEFLEPAGFQDLLLEYLRTDKGEVAGWVSIFSRSSGERSQLQASLREVCQIAREAVTTSLAIAVALGVRLPKLSPIGLSKRERQIAELAASGFSDLNIARQLRISEGTVGRHLQNIFGKLGVRSRYQLAELSLAPRHDHRLMPATHVVAKNSC